MGPKSLSDFKTRMEFMNKDFNADKPRQYEEIRKEMARIYSSVDIKIFGQYKTRNNVIYDVNA